MNKPLLSLVIGVYNVEDYVQRCLTSIDKQFHNFEVIIIDDGSTDKSGEMCDQWALNKDYVKVYHQTNQGISGVRNDGVRYSQGSYVSFIDPDDWIADDYTATLEKLIKDNGGVSQVDVVGFNFNKVTIVNNIEKYSASGDKYPAESSSGEQALEWLLDNKIGNYSWQYAISKKLYDMNNIEFPNMILYEDAATIYRLLFFAKKVICTNQSLYNYFQRSNSFLHKSKLSRTTEYFKLFEQMDSFFIAQNRYDLVNKSREYKLPRLFAAYINFIRIDTNKDEKNYKMKLSSMIRNNFILWPSHFSTLVKEILFYTHLFKPLAYIHDLLNHIK